MDSYVLRAISTSTESLKQVEVSEFRLLCSGVLYNGNVLTADWRRSDAPRFLLSDPVGLTVVSQPIDEYPQELMLSIRVPQVTETFGTSLSGPQITHILFPHRDVAADLASMLSLLLRRLITVHSQTHVSVGPGAARRIGTPIANSPNALTWKARQSVVTYGMEGVASVEDYAPPPVAIDSNHLSALLCQLPGHPDAETILASARLYGQALELIEDRPDIAYVLLISALETVASRAYADWEPPLELLKSAKSSVFVKALDFGLTEPAAQEMVRLACAGLSWSSRKIKMFLAEFLNEDIWTVDELFHIPEGLAPSRGEFDDAISKVLKARGSALHSGIAFPAHVSAGTGPMVPVAAFHAILGGEVSLPPVTWFERIVQSSIVSWLGSTVEPQVDPQGTV